ncbi:MAG: hypothetical protein AAF527_11275 [Pseudomonadota bacterium]
MAITSDVNIDGAGSSRGRDAAAGHATRRRTAVFGGGLLLAGAAAILSPANPGLLEDKELARLLQAMAALKLAIAGPIWAVVWKRLGAPISAPLLASYGAVVAAGAVALALIVSLSFIGLASGLFHGALLGAALAAHQDKKLLPTLFPKRWAETGGGARPFLGRRN